MTKITSKNLIAQKEIDNFRSNELKFINAKLENLERKMNKMKHSKYDQEVKSI